MSFGCLGSISIFFLRREICASIVRSWACQPVPWVTSIRCCRLRTRPGFFRNTDKSLNSPPVNGTSRPSGEINCRRSRIALHPSKHSVSAPPFLQLCRAASLEGAKPSLPAPELREGETVCRRNRQRRQTRNARRWRLGRGMFGLSWRSPRVPMSPSWSARDAKA
jgi:hypothetical protein